MRKSLCVLVLSLVLAAPAGAVCSQSSFSQADLDNWNTMGCWEGYFLWQYKAYDLRFANWSDRGWLDACNLNMEFTMHWAATALLEFDLLDNNDQSFHGTIDYAQTARAAKSAFHNSIYHIATDDTSVFGRFSTQSSGPDQVQTSCLLYDPPSPNANPASRAGDFMHEGWHAWNLKYKKSTGTANGHWPCNSNPDGMTCSNGACTTNGCDYFYFHGISVYVFGAMWENDGTQNRFHSPNQVQVEFLCDIADQPKDYVAASVRQTAAVDANARAAQRFINGPGYSCGSPRPW